MGIEEERRCEERIRLQADLHVELPQQHPRVRDISLSGAFIEDPRLGPGRVFELKLFLGDSEPITATVMVRRVEERCGMGVEFLHMDEANYDRLRKLINGARQEVLGT